MEEIFFLPIVSEISGVDKEITFLFLSYFIQNVSWLMSVRNHQHSEFFVHEYFMTKLLQISKIVWSVDQKVL